MTRRSQMRVMPRALIWLGRESSVLYPSYSGVTGRSLHLVDCRPVSTGTTPSEPSQVTCSRISSRALWRAGRHGHLEISRRPARLRKTLRNVELAYYWVAASRSSRNHDCTRGPIDKLRDRRPFWQITSSKSDRLSTILLGDAVCPSCPGCTRSSGSFPQKMAN